MIYKISQVAEMVGVSVRTLHHYDKIGLFKPETITTAGYRLYTDQDLDLLQQILFFKELDFSLQEINTIIGAPEFDRKKALTVHRKLLVQKKERPEKIIKSVEKTIDSIEGGIEMSKKEMFDVFDMAEIEKYKEKYAEEVKQKYGSSDAYKESSKKTSKYTKEDWARIQAKGKEIDKRIAEGMDKGPSDNNVQDAIAEKRQYITDNFYNCTIEIFRGLGDLYIQDQRFTENIDKQKVGLAKFMREAMKIYCDSKQTKL